MNIWVNGGNTTDFKTAWNSTDKYIIPTQQDQLTCFSYQPDYPSAYLPEDQTPNDYPTVIDRTVHPGKDILNEELVEIYHTDTSYAISRYYSTHWLLDVDNIYGFGQRESGKASDRNVYIDFLRRGPGESIWGSLPAPSWDAFKYGGVRYCVYCNIDTYNVC